MVYNETRQCFLLSSGYNSLLCLVCTIRFREATVASCAVQTGKGSCLPGKNLAVVGSVVGNPSDTKMVHTPHTRSADY